MDLFVRPELRYVRASQNVITRTEPYEFSISVRLDNTRKEGQEDDTESEGAG